MMENAREGSRRSLPFWAPSRLAFFFAAAQGVTGLGLMFFFRPASAVAWADLLDLREASSLSFLRDLHGWGSSMLLVTVLLHLLGSALGGTYDASWRAAWRLAVGLFFVLIAAATTGHLLPALGAGTTPAPLFLTYVLHCAVLPVFLAVLIFAHLGRARRARTATGGETP